jgi:hypothetical protein
MRLLFLPKDQRKNDIQIKKCIHTDVIKNTSRLIMRIQTAYPRRNAQIHGRSSK